VSELVHGRGDLPRHPSRAHEIKNRCQYSGGVPVKWKTARKDVTRMERVNTALVRGESTKGGSRQ
jgi:hypothetical protein